MAERVEVPSRPGDRRARRRLETIETILEIAVELMTREGVGGLSMAAVARRLDVAPPSLYKYFDSLLALYDALFQRGQEQNLQTLVDATTGRRPGLDALAAGLDGTGRWAIENPALAQLLFWRPIPGFQPSEAAFAPAATVVGLLRDMLADAVRAGELGEAATSDEAMTLLAILHFGAISQALANEPDTSWETGRYSRIHPTLLQVFVTAYPPTAPRRDGAPVRQVPRSKRATR